MVGFSYFLTVWLFLIFQSAHIMALRNWREVRLILFFIKYTWEYTPIEILNASMCITLLIKKMQTYCIAESCLRSNDNTKSMLIMRWDFFLSFYILQSVYCPSMEQRLLAVHLTLALPPLWLRLCTAYRLPAEAGALCWGSLSGLVCPWGNC